MTDKQRQKMAQAMARPRQWFTANMDATTPEILIYDMIGTDGWGDGLSPKAFRLQLDAVKAKSDKLNLRINSPGGYIHDGFAIYNALKSSGLEITAYIDGLAASAASFIAMAAAEIYMPKAAEMMIHNAWGMAFGDAGELRKAADHLDSLNETIAGIYVDRTGMEKKEILEMMAVETWMDADQAVTLGFATEIAEDMKAAACAFELDIFDKLPSGFVRYQNALKKRASEQALRDAGLSRAEAKRRAAGTETDNNAEELQKQAQNAITKELKKWTI
jgi:ATP-dependent Clp protease, protease subunit